MKRVALALMLAPMLAVCLPGAALAEPLRYRGYTVGFEGVTPAQQRALEPSIRCQIDIVETVALPAATLDFVRRVPFAIRAAATASPGRYDKGKGVSLQPESLSDKTPVLLHELLHAYHHEVMSVEQRLQLKTFYQRARTPGLWPQGSYMLLNESEYFAMTASAVLNGRIQRDPYTREKVKAAQPIYYPWLLTLFGMTEAQLVPPRTSNCG